MWLSRQERSWQLQNYGYGLKMHIPAWFALWFILGLPKIITGVVFVKFSERNDNIPTFGIESVMKKRRSSLIQFSEKKDR